MQIFYLNERERMRGGGPMHSCLPYCQRAHVAYEFRFEYTFVNEAKGLMPHTPESPYQGCLLH